jgi:hypothetical protein
MPMQRLNEAFVTGTVLQVGDGGRGFVIETDTARYVVTAAHCLRELPPAPAAIYTRECNYTDLVGTFGSQQNVWAECVFVDPVADIAVFCGPDSQELAKHCEAYRNLIDNVTPFALGRLHFRRLRHRLPDGTTFLGNREAKSRALILSLDGKWFPCRIGSYGRSLWIRGAAQPICSGMSGSPIILPDGSAVGVVCVSEGLEDREHHWGGPNPVLAATLPVWLARYSR